MNYGDVDSPGIFAAARRNGGLSKKQPDIANFVDTDAYWDMMGRVIKPMGKIVNIVKTSGMVDLGMLKPESTTSASGSSSFHDYRPLGGTLQAHPRWLA